MQKALAVVLMVLVAAPAAAEKRCVVGKPCGETCIEVTDTCHIPRVPESSYLKSLERKRERSRQLREDMDRASQQALDGLKMAAEATEQHPPPPPPPDAPPEAQPNDTTVPVLLLIFGVTGATAAGLGCLLCGAFALTQVN